jgi:hypothetical protein
VTIPNSKINRLHHDVKKYFRAYFAELRKHIAAHDPSFQVLPWWFRGGREVETIICRDGVVVVHWPYETETTTPPDKPDSYPLYRVPNELVKDRVAKYDHPWPDPTATPNTFSPLIPDYAPGEEFKSGYWPEPRRRETRWEDQGRSIIVTDKWTRLDYLPVSKFYTWQDVPWAREQARFILRRYIELD